VLVDGTRQSSESNALTQVAIEFAVADGSYGHSRNVARRQEVAERSLIDAHATIVAGQSLQFQSKLVEGRQHGELRYGRSLAAREGRGEPI
jgi:hypothetical protein